MKVWITKYALSKGIFEVEVEEIDPEYPNMVIHATKGNWKKFYHGEGKDWHRTQETAIQRAKTMAKGQFKAMEKKALQMQRLADIPKFAEKAVGE